MNPHVWTCALEGAKRYFSWCCFVRIVPHCFGWFVKAWTFFAKDVVVNNVSFSLFSEIYMVKLVGFCIFRSFLIDRKRNETNRLSDQWSKAACLHMYKMFAGVHKIRARVIFTMLDMFVASWAMSWSPISEVVSGRCQDHWIMLFRTGLSPCNRGGRELQGKTTRSMRWIVWSWRITMCLARRCQNMYLGSEKNCTSKTGCERCLMIFFAVQSWITINVLKKWIAVNNDLIFFDQQCLMNQ